MKKLLVFPLLIALIPLAACSMPAGDDQTNVPASNVEPIQPAFEEPESAAVPSGPSAELSEVSGTVEYRLAEADPFESAAEGTELFLNGQIQTGSDGRVRLDFSDGTLVRVTPNSIFTLTEIEDGSDGLLKKLFLRAGQVWIVLNGGSLEVATSSGTASVRGSYMMVSTEMDTGFIKVTCWEGICVLKVGVEEIILHAGESAWFTGDGIESGPMTQEEFQAWLDSTPEAIQVLAMVPGAVGDRVWEDLNGDGLQGEDEPGLAGVTVNLVDAAGLTVASTLTDENGDYLFPLVSAGEYHLEFFMENTLFTGQDAGEDDTL
ncbi:MAG: SdrD B-like domain-containing protein, partial [Anaerolineales bacterium]